MVRHQCYDENGTLVAEFDLELHKCEAVVLEHDGTYYKPTWYNLTVNPQLAKCIPIKVVRCQSGGSKK